MDADTIVDDLADGCDLDFTQEPTADDDAELFVLFAEALDPRSPKTVDGVAAEWQAVFR
jgi:hypothetical protein